MAASLRLSHPREVLRTSFSRLLSVMPHGCYLFDAFSRSLLSSLESPTEKSFASPSRNINTTATDCRRPATRLRRQLAIYYPVDSEGRYVLMRQLCRLSGGMRCIAPLEHRQCMDMSRKNYTSIGRESKGHIGIQTTHSLRSTVPTRGSPLRMKGFQQRNR